MLERLSGELLVQQHISRMTGIIAHGEFWTISETLRMPGYSSAPKISADIYKKKPCHIVAEL